MTSPTRTSASARDRNNLAMIWVNQKGEEKKYTFWDLMAESNKAANILLKYGIHKGDRVLIMLPASPNGGSSRLP